MNNRQRGTWWYLVSIVSAPFMLLAHTGLFGSQAKQDSETAIEDLDGLIRVFVPIAILVLVGIMIGAVIVSLIS